MPLTADEAFDQAANVAKRILIEKSVLHSGSMKIGNDPEKFHLAFEVYEAIVNLKSAGH